MFHGETREGFLECYDEFQSRLIAEVGQPFGVGFHPVQRSVEMPRQVLAGEGFERRAETLQMESLVKSDQAVDAVLGVRAHFRILIVDFRFGNF